MSERISRRMLLQVAGGVALASSFAGSARADFPDRMIRWIVPFPSRWRARYGDAHRREQACGEHRPAGHRRKQERWRGLYRVCRARDLEAGRLHIDDAGTRHVDESIDLQGVCLTTRSRTFARWRRFGARTGRDCDSNT